MAASAADLLQWLDASGNNEVMARVESCLFTGTGIGQLPSAAAVPVSIEVDATALMCDHVELAAAVMQNTREVASQAELLINQQLSRQAATAAIGVDPNEIMEPEESPSIRLQLQLKQVPLPITCATEVQQQAVQLSSYPTAPSSGILVSMLGVVCGVSAPQDVTYSARYHCPACGSTSDVAAHEPNLPCCHMPKTSAAEDLTGRVMVPSQQLWVTGFSSATGHASFGTSRGPLLVHVPEQQVGCASLGAVLHIIGHAKLKMPAGNSTASNVQVDANNIQPMLPHLMWYLPPALSPSIFSKHEQQPLHTMWELLSTPLGYAPPDQHPDRALDPHVAVSLLLSAAAVGGKSRQQQPGAAEQVNVMVLHEGFAPSAVRMLRQTAVALSPQSVAVGVHQLAEHVNTITSNDIQAASEGFTSPVFASTLHLANAGIAVADLPTMPAKAKQQLLLALHQRTTALPKGLMQQLPIPLTATCWASTSWQDKPEGSSRPGRQGSAATVLAAVQAFDIWVGDSTVHEYQLYSMLDECGSPVDVQQEQQQVAVEATAALRHILAAAAACQPPVLSEASQAFLGQYFLVLRQSLGSSTMVSKPVLLSTLMRVAAAVARLHHRNEVLEQPDATLAVLLMEHTLQNKLGDSYRPVLELPCDLSPSNGRTLDDQLAMLHGIMATTFRQYCGAEDDEAGYGCGDGDSGCSGM